MSYRTQKIWDLSFHSCNNNISLLSTGTRACGLMGLSLARPSSGEESVTITVSANQSFCYSKFEIQQRHVITKFHVNTKTVYMCDIDETKKHSQVKAILLQSSV